MRLLYKFNHYFIFSDFFTVTGVGNGEVELEENEVEAEDELMDEGFIETYEDFTPDLDMIRWLAEEVMLENYNRTGSYLQSTGWILEIFLKIFIIPNTYFKTFFFCFQPAKDRMKRPGYNIVNAVVEILYAYEDGHNVINDKVAEELKDYAARFHAFDKTERKQIGPKANSDEIRANSQLNTRFRAPGQHPSRKKKAAYATPYSLHQCELVHFAANTPDRPVVSNRIMQGLVDKLLVKHPSPTKTRKYNATQTEYIMERKTQADLILESYNHIRTALHNSPVDLRSEITLLPLSVGRINGYRLRLKKEEETDLMMRGIILPPQYPVTDRFAEKSPRRAPRKRKALPPGTATSMPVQPEDTTGHARRRLYEEPDPVPVRQYSKHDPAPGPSAAAGSARDLPEDEPAPYVPPSLSPPHEAVDGDTLPSPPKMARTTARRAAEGKLVGVNRCRKCLKNLQEPEAKKAHKTLGRFRWCPQNRQNGKRNPPETYKEFVARVKPKHLRNLAKKAADREARKAAAATAPSESESE